MRRESGFTLVELIVVMAIFGLVMAGVVQMFTSTLTQFKQQGKIAESNIEGIIGLEMLRQDIENAGFGLPWRLSASTVYEEAEGVNASVYNDETASAPMNPPRALVSGGGAGVNGSDVLVIKATNVARSNASQKWTYVDRDNVRKSWEAAGEDLVSTDRVVVIAPGTDDGNRRALVDSSGNWKVTYSDTSSFAPTTGYNFIYGIDDATLRMPFNRADYYILDRTGSTTVPDRCAPKAGILFKGTISQTDGTRAFPLPLLDCVADMQVAFRLDRDGNGEIDSVTDVLTDSTSGLDLTAEEIRNQVKEVRVYILAHEGQKDKNYIHPVTNIRVGDAGIGAGRDFGLGADVNYRWKLYTLIVKPKNLK